MLLITFITALGWALELNTASVSDLSGLNGLSDSEAERIVAHRSSKGDIEARPAYDLPTSSTKLFEELETIAPPTGT